MACGVTLVNRMSLDLRLGWNRYGIRAQRKCKPEAKELRARELEGELESHRAREIEIELE